MLNNNSMQIGYTEYIHVNICMINFHLYFWYI